MTIEYPDQGYNVSWKVRLIVRLEEFNQPFLTTKVPPKPPKIVNGIKDEASGLVAVPDPENPGRFVVQPVGSKKDVLVPETSSDGMTHAIAGVIPKEFDWKQNGFRMADELKIAIRGSDMPLDPRCIRSCAVLFYLGTVTDVEYAQGVRGLRRGDVFGAGAPNAAEPMSVVPDSYLDEHGQSRTNLRFQGFIDKWKMAWGEDEPMIELECRDNTQLLLNQLAPGRLVISGNDPLDKAIAVYLSNFPQFGGFTVEYVPADAEAAPVLKKVLAGTAYRPMLGPQIAGGGDDDLVVWDYLTDVCGAVGLVIFVDGTNIVITRPSTLLGGVASNRPDDPYKSRSLASGDYPARAMIYGKNLSEMEISRDFANKETKNIELRCWSSRRKQLICARYPNKAARIATSTPGDQAAENKWNIVRVRGIEDVKVLEQMAEDYYNGRNRGEIECVLKTKNLGSFGGSNADPDLLDLKAGDAVEVLVDRGASSSLGSNEEQLTSASANAKLLTDLGYSQAFATAYAITYLNAGFQRVYRVREMSVTGDVDQGVSFEIRACNFIQVRGEKSPANGDTSKGATWGKHKR
jgi:hypothetical protein